MTPPNLTNARLESLYALVLRFYPEPFRQAYASPMRQAFRDGLNDSSFSRRNLIFLVAKDLVQSLIREHSTMLRDTFARPTLVYNGLVLAGLATVLSLALYGISQQVLRMGANDPQVQLAGDLVSQLEEGVSATDAMPSGHVDIAHSLAPFLIAYDQTGKPIASQGTLDGSIPTPPKGVFDCALQNGEDRPTWTPRHGVRLATVVRRVGGTHPGFVLAGRSLNEVQQRIQHVWDMATVAWLLMLGLIFVGTTAFGWYTRPRTLPTPANAG
jgi:hypothetical protein